MSGAKSKLKAWARLRFCVCYASEEAVKQQITLWESRHLVGETEAEKTELLEREIPKQTPNRFGGLVLLFIKNDIDTEVVKK